MKIFGTQMPRCFHDYVQCGANFVEAAVKLKPLHHHAGDNRYLQPLRKLEEPSTSPKKSTGGPVDPERCS